MTSPHDRADRGAGVQGDSDAGVAVGFVGLGKMGRPMAGHLAARHPGIIGFDVLEPEGGWPEGVTPVATIDQVAHQVDLVVLSLPDGAVSTQVTRELLAARERRVRFVVDTSTVGVDTARRLAAAASAHGVTYVDAPVSGGVAGAKGGRLTAMCAGTADGLSQAVEILRTFCAMVFEVGAEPGMAQATKLANNYLSGVAIAASCEAVALAAAYGVDPAVAVAVINESTGRNTATTDKFPQQILTERYASGFTSSLLLKDLRLCEEAADRAGTGFDLGTRLVERWARFDAEHPGADVTSMYPEVVRGADRSGPSAG